MKLLSSAASPFGRKVKITMAVKGLTEKIEFVPVDATKGDATLNAANPLGRLPALITPSGETIHDSKVICEYLDTIGNGPVLIPKEGDARWRTLSKASLADGLMEQALLLVYEGRYRPTEMRVETWVQRLEGKIDRTLAQLEKQPPAWTSHPDYGDITLACALGYLDFRHTGKWRAAHPKLVAWLDTFSIAVPAFAATKPVG